MTGAGKPATTRRLVNKCYNRVKPPVRQGTVTPGNPGVTPKVQRAAAFTGWAKGLMPIASKISLG
jgi:hypothetical protein